MTSITASGMILYGVWFLVASLIVYFYSSNLRTMLLTIQYEQKVDSMKGYIIRSTDFLKLLIFKDFLDALDRKMPVYFVGGSALEAAASISANKYMRQAVGIAREKGLLFRPVPKVLKDG